MIMDLLVLVERLSADPIATLKSSLIAGHLFGIILGVGAATLLDILIIRFMILNKVKEEYCGVVEFASKLVTFGLVILWVTGIGFLVHYFLFDPVKLTNQKVWAKIAIVVVLTLNGMFIHRTVLPLMRNRIGRSLFDGITPHQRSLLLVTGAVSATSWYVPVVLGAFPQLNFLPALPILAAYMLLLTTAIVVTHGLARVVIPLTPMVMLSQAEYDILLHRATRVQIPSFATFPMIENRVAFPARENSVASA
jgi:hypothetical protein